MAKKQKSLVGIRNECLFCYNCGASHPLTFPLPLDDLLFQKKLFEKKHKSCEKSWIQPINNKSNEKTERENCVWWLQNGEHGISSKTIYNRLNLNSDLRIQNNSESEPLDPDDFNRCSKLLASIPQFKARLHQLKSVSPEWNLIVENWDILESMLLQLKQSPKMDNGMFHFMQKLRDLAKP